MSGALDGVRVVDFGQYISGPLLAELLSEHGADVIHVDPPGGPRLAGLPDAFLNRGKRRISLDLKQETDRRVASELIAGADVVVENFRPGVMSRLGLGASESIDANRRLVYCSLPGFSATDSRAPIAAWEGVVMSATAGYRRLQDHWDWKARSHAEVDPGRPLFTGIPIASNTAALLGALAVVMALLQRDRTGSGSQLEIPLSEAMLEVVGFHLEMPDFVGSRVPLPRPFLGSYQCSDGRYIDQVPYPRFVEKLLVEAGVWDEWCSEGLGDLSSVFTDADLKQRAERRFARLIRSRPASYWETIAIRLNIPMAQVRTPAEWLSNEHSLASSTVLTLEDPEYGPTTMAGLSMDVGGNRDSVSARTLPDADRRSILDEMDVRRRRRPAEGDRPSSAAGLPLDGVSVVELSQVVAGPLAGRLLADYGADVIKVANPSPTGNNGFHGAYTNRGKRSMYLDIQDAADKQLLWAVIRNSDVVLQNYAFGAIERYGFGYDEVHRIRPDVVYVSLGAYSRSGPWRTRRGHENQAVSATGLSSRYGGEGDWPIYQPYLICDVGTGIMGALATALGLYGRNRSGRGTHISSSLTQVATLHQAAYLFGGPDQARVPEPSGVDEKGWSALQRLYEASDGWFFLAAKPSQIGELYRATVGEDSPPDARLEVEGSRTARILETTFRGHTCAHWTKVLNLEGIAAQTVRGISEVAHDPTWHQRGILRYGTNGEDQAMAPIRGTGPQPWPVPKSSLDFPGPLGADTSDLRAALRPGGNDQPEGTHNAYTAQHRI